MTAEPALATGGENVTVAEALPGDAVTDTGADGTPIDKTLAVPDPLPPEPPLVTVIGRSGPVVTPGATVIVAVTVEPLSFTLEKVTPAGPVTLSPRALTKPLPVITTGVTVPTATLGGEMADLLRAISVGNLRAERQTAKLPRFLVQHGGKRQQLLELELDTTLAHGNRQLLQNGGIAAEIGRPPRHEPLQLRVGVGFDRE